jgi:LysR family transcriptional regulator, transcriptional activator of nhaA
LDGAPAVLPVGEMGLRRQLEQWFDSHGIRPKVVAEVEDTALLTDLGSHGLGFVPMYSAVVDQLARTFRLLKVGVAEGLRMEIFAITVQRRLRHPGVVAMIANPNKDPLIGPPGHSHPTANPGQYDSLNVGANANLVAACD